MRIILSVQYALPKPGPRTPDMCSVQTLASESKDSLPAFPDLGILGLMCKHFSPSSTREAWSLTPPSPRVSPSSQTVQLFRAQIPIMFIPVPENVLFPRLSAVYFHPGHCRVSLRRDEMC